MWFRPLLHPLIALNINLPHKTSQYICILFTKLHTTNKNCQDSPASCNTQAPITFRINYNFQILDLTSKIVFYDLQGNYNKFLKFHRKGCSHYVGYVSYCLWISFVLLFIASCLEFWMSQFLATARKEKYWIKN